MNTEERIAALEARLDQINDAQAEVARKLVKAEIEQWQGRVDDLEVQMHLGTMEATDRLNPMMDELRTTWSLARRQLEDAATLGTETAETLRTGVRNAYQDLRQAILTSSRKVLAGRH